MFFPLKNQYAIEYTSERKYYFFGIPFITVKENETRKDFFLGTSLLLFSLQRRRYSTRFCFGRIELFKIKFNGQIPLTNASLKQLPALVPSKRTLFFNIGNLEESDSNSGIPRTVKSLLIHLTHHQSNEFCFVPVHPAKRYQGFLTASHYLEKLCPDLGTLGNDIPVQFKENDILLIPIPDLNELLYHKTLLQTLQQRGVSIIFVLYDIIPVNSPEYYLYNVREDLCSWLKEMTLYSGIIAISKNTEQEFLDWYRKNIGDPDQKHFFHKWFHLGSDLGTHQKGILPSKDDNVLAEIKNCPSFIEVSTLEPRKGYKQTLAAFEILWGKGIEVNFIVVGRKGWMMDDFAKKLLNHPERNKHLFWVQGASDTYLEQLYNCAAAVLMPSEAEGFGLAIVEGVKYGKPLILRDIPVFRELAGDNAFYFSGLEPESLAAALEQWLILYKQGTIPDSKKIPILSWKESMEQLLDRIFSPELKKIKFNEDIQHADKINEK